jgi:hypothetical protein
VLGLADDNIVALGGSFVAAGVVVVGMRLSAGHKSFEEEGDT